MVKPAQNVGNCKKHLVAAAAVVGWKIVCGVIPQLKCRPDTHIYIHLCSWGGDPSYICDLRIKWYIWDLRFWWFFGRLFQPLFCFASEKWVLAGGRLSVNHAGIYTAETCRDIQRQSTLLLLGPHFKQETVRFWFWLFFCWLVVSNIFLFSIIYGIIPPIDFHIFERVGLNHQPERMINPNPNHPIFSNFYHSFDGSHVSQNYPLVN